MMNITDHWREIEALARPGLEPGETASHEINAARCLFCAGYEAGMKDILKAASEAAGSKDVFQTLLLLLVAQCRAFYEATTHEA